MKPKQNRMVIFALGTVIAALMMGAGGVANSAQLPKVISLATLAPGTSVHTISTREAEIITKNTPMRVMVESYEGPGVFIPLMKKGQVELCKIACPETYWAYYGLLSYKEPTGGKGYGGLRTVFIDSGAIVGMVAGGDTGIKATRDLKGKRIAQVDPAHLSPYLTNRAMVANGGLDPDKDVTWVPSASVKAGNKLVIERKADVCTNAFGAAYVEEIHASRGVRWVTADASPEGLKRFTDIHPSQLELIKAGAGTGVIQDTWLSAFRRAVHCWETLPDALVYTIVETIWNHVDELKTAHPLVRKLTRERLCTTAAAAPFHPGAIKFFKEKGLWTDEMKRHQEALLAKR